MLYGYACSDHLTLSSFFPTQFMCSYLFQSPNDCNYHSQQYLPPWGRALTSLEVLYESICLFLLLNGLYSFFKSLLLTIIIYKCQESYSFCWMPLSRYYFLSSHLMLGEDLFFSTYAFGGWPLFWREMVHLYAKLECIDSTAFQVIT